MEFWIEIGRSFGVPVMVLGALMLGCYKVARWVGNELIIPVRDVVLTKAVSILDKMDKTITALEAGINELTNGMENYAKLLSSLETSAKATAQNIVTDHKECHDAHCDINESLKSIVGIVKDVKSKTDTLASQCPILVKPPEEQEENTANTGILSRATPVHGIPTSTRILTHPPGQIPPTPGHGKRGPKS